MPPDVVLVDPQTGEETARKPLPGFGSVAECEKCGTSFAEVEPAVRWKPSGEKGVLDGGAVVDDEAMMKQCRSCGWTFAEAPKVKGR